MKPDPANLVLARQGLATAGYMRVLSLGWVKWNLNQVAEAERDARVWLAEDPTNPVRVAWLVAWTDVREGYEAEIERREKEERSSV